MRPPKSAVMQEQPSHSMPRCSPDCTPLAEPKTDWGLWRSRSACRRQRTQRHRGHRQVVRPLPPRCLCLCVEEVLTIPLESLGLHGRKIFQLSPSLVPRFLPAPPVETSAPSRKGMPPRKSVGRLLPTRGQDVPWTAASCIWSGSVTDLPRCPLVMVSWLCVE